MASAGASGPSGSQAAARTGNSGDTLQVDAMREAGNSTFADSDSDSAYEGQSSYRRKSYSLV